ncbi:FbpB family small basic protein [Halalkalibacter alkaliphilus]|uniref:FbpB family small basic protein n=1 Tax=Halalkalibacter alkaliphilus TaxID=2917993 RepID=A0A9X2I6W5_9BACI|nr:FbpB family small basic protein [Halalkalibacter alkaliphilus]MCL7747385.1 FbpB family small basic protein [Halalkalibacter alkaliphilus]
MRRVRKLSFEELVRENKEKLLRDKEALDRLEEKWERKRTSVNQMEI